MLVRDRVSRIYYNKHFFDYPISMKPETIKNMGFVTTMKAGFSYLWACVFKKPETNLENFYINRFGKVLYSMFFEGYTEKALGQTPKRDIRRLGLTASKKASITALLKDMFKKVFGTKNKGEVETSLIEQFWYPKYGPGQLWETAANKVKRAWGGQVKKIMCEGETRVCHTVTLLPLVCWSISSTLKNETNKTTLGNIVPDCWIYVQDKGVKLGRIQIFNNWSPYMVEKPEDTVWIGL